MITQDQYRRLCFDIQENKLGESADACNVADLLEAFEQLHDFATRTCESGSRHVRLADFELLYDENGEQKVVLHGQQARRSPMKGL